MGVFEADRQTSNARLLWEVSRVLLVPKNSIQYKIIPCLDGKMQQINLVQYRPVNSTKCQTVLESP